MIFRYLSSIYLADTDFHHTNFEQIKRFRIRITNDLTINVEKYGKECYNTAMLSSY